MGITAKGALESASSATSARSARIVWRDLSQVSYFGDVVERRARQRHAAVAQDPPAGSFGSPPHLFLDPTPVAERSFVERERMSALPRSSSADYDASLTSAGGGIYPRSAKFIPITPQVRAALGIDEEVTQLTPAEVLRAILKAPVELLWNGGIGVYVKAASESHDECGDRANNALRVNGGELRCRIIGEGGNLGLTQRGRIEFALAGGLLNTDFIDNSAGVDTSDHEVNIKILLNTAISLGQLTLEQRDELLVAMTDEVERLVLFGTTSTEPRDQPDAAAVDSSTAGFPSSTSCARWNNKACSTARLNLRLVTSSSRSAKPRARV
ncbi:MAG: NAD-glutamate dehydrogenase [Rhodanobacteraceae bacterium]|nr:NAD-glutamate dehydrogenase [Rhodanobacteraceae bacterium]